MLFHDKVACQPDNVAAPGFLHVHTGLVQWESTVLYCKHTLRYPQSLLADCFLQIFSCSSAFFCFSAETSCSMNDHRWTWWTVSTLNKILIVKYIKPKSVKWQLYACTVLTTSTLVVKMCKYALCQCVDLNKIFCALTNKKQTQLHPV